MIKSKKEEREKLKQYRNNLVLTLDKLNDKYYSRLIDYESYKSLFDNCIKEIDYYNNKISELSKKNYKMYIISSILLLIFIVGLIFLRPTITGYFVKEPQEVYIDGYDYEGKKWANINGDGLYERCLLIENPVINFNSVLITAKIAIVDRKQDLRFRIYNTDKSEDPGNELGSCIVKDYSKLLKSCEISNLNQAGGYYWICTYSEGEKDETYYTIAYNNDDDYTRAFWTGKYWQKMKDSSYTIEAEFRKW